MTRGKYSKNNDTLILFLSNSYTFFKHEQGHPVSAM